MSFSLLANELVLLIITYIPPSEIEAFALINTKCHALSLPALTAHLKHKHNAAAMVARFPHHSGHIGYLSPSTLVERGLIEKGMIPNLEYLHLDGDLHWLRLQTPEIAAEHFWERGRAASPEAVQKLVADADRLGLTLPPGFATLIGAQDLVQRLHLDIDTTIKLGELFKCTPEQDGGKGGCVVRFISGMSYGLYMDPAGHSCVVHAEKGDDFSCGCCEPNQPPAAHQTIVEADPTLRFICVNTEWEEWMAVMYFDGWLYGTLRQGREVVGCEMEYVRHFQ
ncbi:hypothetical protein B0H16DRAFT_63183 [Mycena metata]|uniref:F-box domain-containing protein n=1 Tax=Mycena metata TaxID=1033252 RepID=A0AAD7IBW2_9AGAR|nr:hypothetical protein B0H16DRAFT_63183 [Mycena metata]